MIVATSRFRVANGLEGQVRDAFARRPRLVDREPGFLGLEVFTDAEDAAVFHLVTRWTDRQAFERWHASENHRASHAWIPRGLKLEAAFTRLEVVERIEEDAAAGAIENAVRDAAPLWARHLAATDKVYFLVASPGGTVRFASPALDARLGGGCTGPEARSLWELLVEPDARRLRDILTSRRPDLPPQLLNFVGADGQPFTVHATVDVDEDRVVVLGAPEADDRATGQMLQLTEELTVLARDQAKQRQAAAAAHAELARVHKELQESHWHLRKIQEVLPICMRCHRVKTAEGRWDELIRFFQEHSGFLSHSYCPPCARELRAEWGLDGAEDGAEPHG